MNKIGPGFVYAWTPGFRRVGEVVMRRWILLLGTLAMVPACAEDSAYVVSAQPCPVQVQAPPPVASLAAIPVDGPRILVTDQHHLDRATEVLGLVDVHAVVGAEAAAMAELRTRAAALGADAVLGAEFHHGEAFGEPMHLSGMAVRFIAVAP
jgi:hypothetical protein